MNAYSKDLRLGVLAAVDRGAPRARIVETLEVSLAIIRRYARRRRETGEVALRPSPGRTLRIGKTAERSSALCGSSWRPTPGERAYGEAIAGALCAVSR